MKKYLYLLIAMAIVGFVVKTAWEMHLQYNGVCLEKGRSLTDEEKIQAMIKDINTYDTRSVNFVPYKRVPFASVEGFLEENPDCCTVEVRDFSYGGDSFSFSRAIGAYAGHVTVHYTLHYLDENGVEKKTPDTLTGTIQNCGVMN